MAEKDFNYNLTTTFYAKWILPFVLFVVGGLLILLFLPGMKFRKGKDYDTGVELVFYAVKENGADKYIEVKEKYIYELKNKGSYEYYYNTQTVYDKNIPWYSAFRMNLSTMGTAGGAGLSIVGVFMLVINIFNRISKVNTKKIGEYKITYSVKKSFLKVSKKRTVKVVDEKKPKITLEGDKDLTICPDSKYKELGYKAIDEYDGDLTKKVETKEEDKKVTYTVKDKSGNTAKVVRNIKREDKTKPELKLNGNDHIYVTLGNGYKDSGATATDNCSGDLTEKIETSGSVNINSLGDYKITYKVTDDHGNTSTIERTVTVQKEIVRRSASLGCGEPGVIYLTFDDGPNNGTTTQILDVLKKYNVKATFFVTSTNGGSDSQIKREFDEGHLVALHTSTHNYAKIYASDNAYWDDLNAINSRVEKITGKKSNIVRFPGGSSNTVSRHYSTGIMSRLANDLESKGYSYFDWNLDSRDAENKPCNEVRSNVINGLSKSRGNVVLMHDIKGPTACAIEDIVKYGLDNGYTFKVLDSSVVCHHKTAN